MTSPALVLILTILALALALALARPRESFGEEAGSAIFNGTRVTGSWYNNVAKVKSAKGYGSGVLIRPDVILTARHVIESSKPKDVKVIVGTNDLNGPSRREHGVSRIVTSRDLDFGLLFLSEPVKGVRPARLAGLDGVKGPKLIPGKTWLTIVGWGSVASKVQPRYLQSTQVRVHSISPESLKTVVVNPRNPSGSCPGDSGAPLFANGIVAAIHSSSQLDCGRRTGGTMTSIPAATIARRIWNLVRR